MTPDYKVAFGNPEQASAEISACILELRQVAHQLTSARDRQPISMIWSTQPTRSSSVAFKQTSPERSGIILQDS